MEYSAPVLFSIYVDDFLQKFEKFGCSYKGLSTSSVMLKQKSKIGAIGLPTVSYQKLVAKNNIPVTLKLLPTIIALPILSYSIGALGLNKI